MVPVASVCLLASVHEWLRIKGSTTADARFVLLWLLSLLVAQFAPMVWANNSRARSTDHCSRLTQTDECSAVLQLAIALWWHTLSGQRQTVMSLSLFMYYLLDETLKQIVGAHSLVQSSEEAFTNYKLCCHPLMSSFLSFAKQREIVQFLTVSNSNCTGKTGNIWTQVLQVPLRLQPNVIAVHKPARPSPSRRPVAQSISIYANIAYRKLNYNFH